MRFKLKDQNILNNPNELEYLPSGKLLINTINAHSFNIAQKDELFAKALSEGDVLIPDGASIIWACKFLKAKSRPQMRCAGWDLFEFEMKRLNENANQHKRVMFMGSSEIILSLIREKCRSIYLNLEVITYSPPYKHEFSDEDNSSMIRAINEANPDLLWIGMTAPKQEKWTYTHWNELNIHCHVGTIGAVFDFFAETAKRAPLWWQKHGLEWLYRLIKEPRRLWRRYVLGNPLFLYNIIKERLFGFLS